jgi:hypothetical protein
MTRLRRRVRLAATAAGIGLAAAAWYFVPTTTGYSLVGATGEIDALAALPVGDTDGYRAWRDRRADVLTAYPDLKARADGAERAWLDRTVDQLVAEADARLGDDPLGATTRLRLAAAELGQAKGFVAVRGRLTEARKRALRAAVEAARHEALGVVKKKKGDPDCMRAAAAVARRLQADFGDEAAELQIDEVERFGKGYAFLAALEESANRPRP